MNLAEEIKEYSSKRKLKVPDVWEALGWATRELGEVYEVLFSFSGGWVRNNPEKHPQKSKEDLAEELGDVIMMIMMAGIAEGVDPLEALLNKMKRKLEKKTATFTTQIVSVTDGEENGTED